MGLLEQILPRAGGSRVPWNAGVKRERTFAKKSSLNPRPRALGGDYSLPPKEVREGDGEYAISNFGRTRCTSVSRSTGKRCKAYSVDGGTTCKFHGGRHVPKDILIAMGRYDAVIRNEKLREKYLRWAKDKELTEQNDDLALARAMLEVIVERAFKDNDSVEKMNLDGISPVMQMIKEITALIDKISDREMKLQSFVNMQTIEGLMSKFVDIITRNVHDQEVVRRIARELGSVDVAGILPSGSKQIESQIIG